MSRKYFADIYSGIKRDNELRLSKSLEEKFHIEGLNLELLQQALSHRSFIKEMIDLGEEVDLNYDSYQRLELLGDKVLGLVITQYLYANRENYSEGEITRMVEGYVNNDYLAKIAEEIGLGNYLYLGNNQGSIGTKILADSFEALIGVIYLSKSIEEVDKFVRETIVENFDEKYSVNSTPNVSNYKNALQEICQKHGVDIPEYEVISESGADHQKTFTVAVYIKGNNLGSGTANRKKDAEKIAAEQAYKYLING
ncbi:ribonuclease III [Mycoplasmatota bacterium zrk1]